MKKLFTLVILSVIGITQIYSQCFQCDSITKAFTIGTQNVATGDNSFAGGFRTLTSGENSFVFGDNSRVTESGGIAFGNTVKSSAANSIVFGQYVTGNAANSITFGAASSSSQLINSKPNSIMFGVTEIPSLTIVKPFGADVGYLGIGTATPAEMLHITGNILSEGDLTVKDKITLTPDYTDSTFWKIERDKNGLNFLHTEQITKPEDSAAMKGGIGGTWIPFNRLFINNNGSVGIGTTTPSAKLDVNGSANITNTLTASALSAQSADIADALTAKELRAQSADIAGTLTADELNAQNATISRALSASTATITNLTANALEAQNANIINNLGIRCSNPLAHIQIGGIWTFFTGSNDESDKIIGRNTIWNGINNVRMTEGIASRIYFSGSGNIVFQTAATGAANSVIDGYWKTLCLKNNGDVGIGTSDPGAKLDVIGTIRAHQVKICLNQGCDYVFEDGYNLMNLKDLERFIKTHKHLPDVAPAAEMEAEGINLGEMSTTLLQKIEELTLYILDLQKQIDELKTK